MNKNLSEQLRANVEGAADIDTSDFSSSVYLDARDFRRIFCHAQTTTTIDSADVLTLQLRQATDSSGTGAKDLGTAFTFTADATEVANVVGDALVSSMDEAGGFYFVGFQIGTDKGSAVVGAASLVLGDAKFEPVVQPS